MSDQSQDMYQINNFTEFLENCLDRKVLEYTLKPLTKPGENYGSVMQSVEVKLDGKSNSEETEVLQLVTKTSITNPFLVQIFQPALSFVKEAHFYSDIIPSLEQLEQSAKVPEVERIDAFIKCFGSRLSLDPNVKRADFDAIILLENIKFLDFKNANRYVGLNVVETQAVLKQLAKFNALCIAVRRLQPDVFNSKIRPFLEPINFNDNPQSDYMIDSLCRELQFIDNLDSTLRENIEKQLRHSFDFTRSSYYVPETPFTTVSHRDLWVNNVMIKDDEERIKTKIYDFQVYFYETLALDLIFFLCTSVKLDKLTPNFKHFIEFYHEEFIKMLKLVNCPLNDYTFEKMWREIKDKAKMELAHAIMFTKLCLMEESDVPKLDELTPGHMLDKRPSQATLDRYETIINLFIEYEFL